MVWSHGSRNQDSKVTSPLVSRMFAEQCKLPASLLRSLQSSQTAFHAAADEPSPQVLLQSMNGHTMQPLNHAQSLRSDVAISAGHTPVLWAYTGSVSPQIVTESLQIKVARIWFDWNSI